MDLFLHFNSHFSRGTWVSWYQYVSVLDFIGSNDNGGGGDKWSYKTSNRHHQQTNTQLLTLWTPS